MIAVIAEGLNTIEHANAGKGEQEVVGNDAAARPWAYENGIAVAEVAEVGRRDSAWLVVGRPVADAFARSPRESPTGRWSVLAAVEKGVSATAITTSLYERFQFRRDRGVSPQIPSAMPWSSADTPKDRMTSVHHSVQPH